MIKGVQEINQKLERIRTAWSPDVVKTLIRPVADDIARTAAGEAPISDRERIRYARRRIRGRRNKKAVVITRSAPGTLKRSIQAIDLHSDSRFLFVAPSHGRRSAHDAYYAHFVHEGVALRGGGRTQPNPFMQRAYSSMRAPAVRRLTAIFERHLKKYTL